MKLQKYQIEHARSRLFAALAEKVTKKFGKEPRVLHISREEKLNHIYSGKAKMLPRKDVCVYTDLLDAYEYVDTKYQESKAKHEEYVAQKEAFYKSEQKKVERIMDELILSGDAAAVLAKIEAYTTSK